jgi:saccharopine dehydrogenase (NAD+, L-lysine-forming)
MATKTILILGGYGETGKVLCSYLLKQTNAQLVIAGRRLSKAERLCAELRNSYPKRKVSAVFADASNRQALVKAFKGIDLIVDATSAVDLVSNVAKAALEAGVDYLDYHFDQNVFFELEKLKSKIDKSGHLFITQAGFHPGLPSAFVRLGATYFDTLNKAIVGMAMSSKIEKPESIYELVDVIADYQVDIFKEGRWQLTGYRDFKKINFGQRFGTRTCYPIQLVEMRDLPAMFPLTESGVYVAGFNWFADYIVFPLAFVLFKIKRNLGRHFIAQLLTFALNYFSRNLSGVSFVLEEEGMKNGQPTRLRITAESSDAYAFTAIPVVACIQQYLDGNLPNTGLWMMGHIVDPKRLITDMREMGVIINIQTI